MACRADSVVVAVEEAMLRAVERVKPRRTQIWFVSRAACKSVMRGSIRFTQKFQDSIDKPSNHFDNRPRPNSDDRANREARDDEESTASVVSLLTRAYDKGS
jgi:hypothetical protein